MKTVTGRDILIVEDNTKIAEEYAQYFRSRLNNVFTAKTLEEAEKIIAEKVLDAILLDVILPDGDGLDLLSRHEKLPPVIVVSTLGTDLDVVDGLAAGAVDYVIKPCSPEVLEARLSLRLLPKPEATICAQGITVDICERTATYGGKFIPLTGSEFNVLYFFITHIGTFFTAAQIYENVWNAPSLKTTTIKYHISNLRQKLLAVTGKNAIVTAFGKGYAMFKEDENES